MGSCLCSTKGLTWVRVAVGDCEVVSVEHNPALCLLIRRLLSEMVARGPCNTLAHCQTTCTFLSLQQEVLRDNIQHACTPSLTLGVTLSLQAVQHAAPELHQWRRRGQQQQQ